MLKDITLGQYFPGDTLAHRLDPRTKLLATVLYIIAIFLAKGPIAYGVLMQTKGYGVPWVLLMCCRCCSSSPSPRC